MSARRARPARPGPVRSAGVPVGVWIVLLVLVVPAAFHNSLQVPFLLDDADSIVNNPSIRSLATAWRPPGDSGFTVSGRPLLNVSFAVNHAIHGTSVAGYHVGNILIHLAATLCLFAIARRTLLQPGPARHFAAHAAPLAALGAALWAVHPMQTAAVTYIVQRAEVLVGLCLLGTLYAFIRATTQPSRAWGITAVAACWLGMTAKEVMAAAPLVVFLYDRTFVSGTFREAWRRHGRLHLALAAGWLLLGALVFASGARGSTVGFGVVPWGGHVLTQLAGIGRYLGHVVYPPGLVFDYGAMVENRAAPIVIGSLVVLVLVAGTLVLLRRAPQAGFLGAWFLLILAPTSSIIPVASQTLAEHRMYLPLAAVAFAVVVGLYRYRPRVAWIVLPILGVACVTGTIARNRTFASAITLWEDTVAKAPYSTRAWTSLAVAYLEVGRSDDALRCMARAAELSPRDPGVQADTALALVKSERRIEALAHYERAIELAPEFAEARIGYGQLLRSLNRLDESVAQLQVAVKLAPNSARARCQLGIALRVSGRTAEAIEELTEAARLDPNLIQARYFLGDALADSDRREEAIGHLQAVAALSPQPGAELFNYLGVLYAQTERLPEAVACFRRALAIEPGHVRARDNLAMVESRLRELGR